ncbi:signal peptidase I [Paramicrobacterium agarici]|uniref:Signal peptidase I n=1 Tax=Paramicrobacterium agarici TaxID=630514 RepID=A0A2A9DW43_9MICO|nr:signal peptidase I [Microbacterium agarici]PFG30586.1 signal peptidase [Microbacterium agarici]TQO23604.1 signal peptidase [Microbacterium agarici]
MLRNRTHVRSREDAPHGIWRRVRGAVTTCLFAAVVLLFWPASLGGCSTLTIVSGHSMDPTYHTGDIVWARCGVPQIGDIVVYQPDGVEGARVIHRIIDGSSVGWTMKGDNNDAIDPWSPSQADIIGVAQGHIPGVGKVLLAFGHPLVWISLLVLAAALLVWPQKKFDGEAADHAAESLSVNGPAQTQQLQDASKVTS